MIFLDIVMPVPGNVVDGPVSCRTLSRKDLDEPYAAFDQAPCYQALPGKCFALFVVDPIQRSGGRSFLANIQRLWRSCLHAVGQLEAPNTSSQISLIRMSLDVCSVQVA